MSAPLQPERAVAPLLSLRQVGKRYLMGGQPVDALRSIDLEIQPGEFVALVGPSGSGKSTLLNLCGLVDRPDRGEISLAGQEVSGLDEIALAGLRRERIGFVFQGFNLIPVMTAFENVEYPLMLAGVSAEARQARVTAMLDQVGLSAQARRRPDEMSGGQRQRVAIARALVKCPALVVADEPTANLDSQTALQVVALMHELGRTQGATFVVATHDARLVAHCDRQVTLADGILQ